MTSQKLKEVKFSIYMDDDDLQTLQAMVDEAKADEPEALKDWNTNSEVCFIVTHAMNEWRKTHMNKEER